MGDASSADVAPLDLAPLDLARSAIAAVHASRGRPVPEGLRAGACAATEPDGLRGAAGDDVPGWVALGLEYEARLGQEARSAGAHYTPSAIAAGLVALTGLAARSGAPAGEPGPSVWDPACGGGAFLLAAADALLAAGHDPAVIVADLLWGTDLDPGAVAVADAALVWWAADHGAPTARPGDHLVVADSLMVDRPGPADGFDVVVGNPPFQGQLAAGNVRDAQRRSALRDRFGSDLGAYTDTAALFWVTAVRSLAPGGRAALVIPTSILSARDAGPARRAVSRAVDLTDLWWAGESVFEASVEVCAPVVRRRDAGASVPPGDRPAIRRWRGSAFEPLADAHSPLLASEWSGIDGSWSPLLLAALDVPEPRFNSLGTMADLARATAGFRDEYYGLVDHVSELDGRRLDAVPGALSPLVTTGLVDVGTCAWGSRPVRFARRGFDQPVVDRAAVLAGGGRAAAWLRTTEGPKVVVATQTRVGEAAVDESGTWVPSTPMVALLPLPASSSPDEQRHPGPDPSGRAVDSQELWRWAAVVCSPVGSVVALAQTAGSGRSRDTIRPRVDTVLALPLPVDREAWTEGAVALQTRDQQAFVDAMSAAYAVHDPAPLAAWWWPLAPWPSSTP